MKKIYIAKNLADAHLLKGLLEGENIEAEGETGFDISRRRTTKPDERRSVALQLWRGERRPIYRMLELRRAVRPAKKRRVTMLEYELNRAEGILILKPIGPLESTDFEKLVREVDPYIRDKGKLKGLMIYAKSFPGWDNFAAFLSHMKFVKNHHKEVKKIAAVTGSGFLSIIPQVANHFIQAEVRHFDYNDKDAALNWLTAGN